MEFDLAAREALFTQCRDDAESLTDAISGLSVDEGRAYLAKLGFKFHTPSYPSGDGPEEGYSTRKLSPCGRWACTLHANRPTKTGEFAQWRYLPGPWKVTAA